jgi:hypothetical protein
LPSPPQPLKLASSRKDELNLEFQAKVVGFKSEIRYKDMLQLERDSRSASSYPGSPSVGNEGESEKEDEEYVVKGKGKGKGKF